MNRFMDQNSRHGKNDDKDEANTHDLDGNLLNVQMPFHPVNVGDFAENSQPVRELFAPNFKIKDLLISEKKKDY